MTHFPRRPILLYLITKSELGGAQSHVRELGEHFCLEYEVHLAVGQLGALTDDLKATGVKIHHIPSLTREMNLLADLRAIWDFIVLIRQIQPAILHAHSSKAGMIGRIASRFCGVPAVFTAHGWGFTPNTPPLRRSLARWIEQLLAPLTAKIICVSESDRQFALQLGVGRPASLVTIHNGIPNAAVPPAQPAQSPPHLIMVARFNEQKDQSTLLRAIAQLPPASCTLDLVGSGPGLAACQALATSLALDDRVNFLGDRHDVPELLARSQIFVLSTHYEGLPISILEAMRAGLPVIATRVNGIPEAVDHGTTGWLCSHEDAEALALGVKTLLQSPTLRQQMGQASREKFLQEFTLDTMQQQIQTIYQQIRLQGKASNFALNTRPELEKSSGI